MRKTTLCLSILLAVAVTTAADAKKRARAAKPAVSTITWPQPYPSSASTLAQRDAFLGAAINPMRAK